MAHLNLAMIHPYRGGNGRMARALQTMVLAHNAVLEPTFASIEEWLGQHTDDYCAVLAATGGRSWQPDRSTRLWLKFNLRAHHLQAQTLKRRFAEAQRVYAQLDQIIAGHRLPERMAETLFDAALGSRVTRPNYRKRVENLEDRTATRDLVRLAELGLLEPRGQTRGRYYLAAGEIAQFRDALRSPGEPLADPYPRLMGDIRRSLG